MVKKGLAKIWVFGLIFSVSEFAFSAPVINVGSLNEYIHGNNFAKRISNSGTSTAFVRVTVDEIMFSGSEAIEKPLDTRALVEGKGTGLLSSPPRLIIPANGTQTNRLLFIGERDRERYYRVRYIPVIPDDINEFNLSEKEVNNYRENIDTQVTVLTGYGAIMTVLPEKVKFNTSIVEDAGRIKVINNGNASIILDAVKECDSNGRNCTNPLIHSLRPGMHFERSVKPGKTLHYTLIEGRKKKPLRMAGS